MKSKIEFHPLFSLTHCANCRGKKEEYEKQKGFARDCKARKYIRKENNKIRYYFSFALTATQKCRSTIYEREAGPIVPDTPWMDWAGGNLGWRPGKTRPQAARRWVMLSREGIAGDFAS